jgi:hypothetical protein
MYLEGTCIISQPSLHPRSPVYTIYFFIQYMTFMYHTRQSGPGTDEQARYVATKVHIHTFMYTCICYVKVGVHTSVLKYAYVHECVLHGGYVTITSNY